METIELEFPFKTGSGEELKEVTLQRRPKVKDYKEARRIAGAEAGGDEVEMAMIAVLSGLIYEDLAEMDFADYQAIAARFQKLAVRAQS